MASFAVAGFAAFQALDPAPPLRAGFDVAPAEVKTITELKADAGGHYIAMRRSKGQSSRSWSIPAPRPLHSLYEDADRVGLRTFALTYDVPVATANGIAKGGARHAAPGRR